MGKMSDLLKKTIEKAEQKKVDPPFTVIVEVAPEKKQAVMSEMSGVGGSILETSGDFISVRVPNSTVAEQISQIDGVENVSKETYVTPMAQPFHDLAAAVGIKQDPLFKNLSQQDRKDLGVYAGPTAQLPKIQQSLSTPKLPFAPPLPLGKETGKEPVTVSQTRKIIGAPEENKLSDIKTAVIDSGVGITPFGFHPAFKGVYKQENLSPEPPGDFMAHGTWCTTCAFGETVSFPYGVFKSVAQVKKQNFLHVKVFGSIGGATNFQILKAMDRAAAFGADIVSMSLGGPQQGTVDKDPQCKKAEKLYKKQGINFIVAAGNSGPDDWTIGSPGNSPYVLTVGSIGAKTLEISKFSSRGPQGRYYKEHREAYQNDKRKYGDALLKPDVMAPGGTENRQIISGVTGWYDGHYDGTADMWEQMIGTSMATPHVAGLAAILMDEEKIGSIQDIKDVMRQKGKPKNKDRGYGLIRYAFFENR